MRTVARAFAFCLLCGVCCVWRDRDPRSAWSAKDTTADDVEQSMASLSICKHSANALQTLCERSENDLRRICEL